MDKLYTFEYQDCIYESVMAIQSLHRTRKGAEIALDFHKEEERKKWIELDRYQRSEYGDDYEILKGSPFGSMEAWCIGEIEILE